jgi:hypothetical protein
MFNTLKRFDIHTKAIEGVHQQTIIGAILTLVTTLLVFILLFSEISVFFTTEVVSRMVVDTAFGVEAVKLEFDISFPTISCDGITFTQELTRGNIHTFETISELEKNEVENPDPKSFPGCRLKGSFLTDKIAGNFRFAISPQRVPLNLSHSLHKIAFQPNNAKNAKDKLPEIMDSVNETFVDIPLETGIYQYSITVVPTQYKTLYGELSFINQYAVIEKAIPVDNVLNFEAQNSLFIKDFQGIIVSYDFHPVRTSFCSLYLISFHLLSLINVCSFFCYVFLGCPFYGREKRTNS